MILVVNSLIQFVVAMLATIAFAILFMAPRKELLVCGFTGALGWLVYYVMTQLYVNIIMSAAVATFVLTIFARAFAVIRRAPATVYLISGIFPLVPGAGIYYTAYYLFNNNNSLSGAKAIETFELAGAIVFGIIFGFAIPQKIFQRLRKPEVFETYVEEQE